MEDWRIKRTYRISMAERIANIWLKVCFLISAESSVTMHAMFESNPKSSWGYPGYCMLRLDYTEHSQTGEENSLAPELVTLPDCVIFISQVTTLGHLQTHFWKKRVQWRLLSLSLSLVKLIRNRNRKFGPSFLVNGLGSEPGLLH